MSADGRTQRVTIDRIVVRGREREHRGADAADPIVAALAEQVDPETAGAVAGEIWSRLSEGRR